MHESGRPGGHDSKRRRVDDREGAGDGDGAEALFGSQGDDEDFFEDDWDRLFDGEVGRELARDGGESGSTEGGGQGVKASALTLGGHR